MKSSLAYVIAPLCLFTAVHGQAAQHSDFLSKCEALSNITTVENYSVTVVSTSYVAANSSLNPAAEGRNETCVFDAPYYPAAACRLRLQVPTSNSSSVQMEVWLPEEWNGRFLSTGNGGFAGCTSSRCAWWRPADQGIQASNTRMLRTQLHMASRP